jgi:hypothetical protein
MSAILAIPAEIGALVLKFAVAKYIEGAGSAPGAMSTRASALAAIASEIQGVAAGTVTIAQLQAATAAQLQAKGVAPSTQILVNGLVEVLSGIFPTGPSAGLISAALAADVNLFASDVIAVADTYTAAVQPAAAVKAEAAE